MTANIDNLTDEDLEQLDDLLKKEKQNEEKQVKYQWDDEFQKEIFSLLFNKEFLLRMKTIMRPFYFTKESLQIGTNVIFEHFDKYKSIPTKAQFVNEVKKKIESKKPDTQMGILLELEGCFNFHTIALESRGYYEDKIAEFSKNQAIMDAMGKAIIILKENLDRETKSAKLQKLFGDALNTEVNFDEGLDYFNTVEDRYKRKEERSQSGEVYTTGFPSLDASLKNGGLIKGEMVSWMGASGSGKSLALVTAAKANIKRGKKVLYISLEIEADAVAERLDAQLADPDGIFGIKMSNLSENSNLIVEKVGEYVENLDDSKLLVIKRFPGGQLDVMGFRAYFSQLVLRGFRPDVVIIDYLGEMKDYSGMEKHESRYQMTRDLRGIAVQEEFVLFTAMQPNKSGKDVVKQGLFMDDENLGDSFSQVKPLDALWSLNQLQDEKECCLARGYACKTRDGKSKFCFYIKFNYDNLSMTEIDVATYEFIKKEHRLYKDKTATDMTMEEMGKKFKNSSVKKNTSMMNEMKNASNDLETLMEN